MAKKGIHFNISERKILLRIFDALFVLLSLFLVSYFFDFDYFANTSKNRIWVIVLLFYLSAFGTVFELYNLQKSNKWESVLANITITSFTVVLVYLFTPFFTPTLPTNRLQIVYFFLAIFVALCVWRIIYIAFVSSPRFFKNVLIVGDVSTIEIIVNVFRKADPNYNIIGFINCEEKFQDGLKYNGVKEYQPEQILDIITSEKISEIVVATYNSEAITPEIYHRLISLLDQGFAIREFTQVYEEVTNRVPIQFVGKEFYRYFPFSRSNQNTLYLFFQRAFDVVFSITGLIFCLVILPFIIIGNAIANKGPLLYFQERVGRNGKPFQIVKFRSMVINAEKGGAEWAQKNDVRITKFGKFLRRTRLDEVPQFFNVLVGEMSIIGPRPERPFFVSELSKVIPFYETRHIIKPGLTGWAQVKTRYGASIDESLIKLQYDLFYIKHRSVFLDLNIIVKTMSTILYYRGQ